MATFLKQKTVPVGDDKVTLTQLSGLDRYDFMDFCSEQTFPESVEALSENASKEEKEAQLQKMEKVTRQWNRLNFIMQARLVAHGTNFDIDDIDERHQYVMSAMSKEQIKELHDEVAKLSGMSLPDETPSIEEDAEPEMPEKDGEQEDDLEPVDPKA
ncbi:MULTISPECIES: phage minor tail protein domain-containing protein [unclassified Vibrio]|uniref:phage minor tail protein domain-containing protein n=1 Tax=unclassified Vibrio TaxID=2614977 RepID=UPI0029642ACB|nr:MULTISPECIES: phage minor tail protein G [unclassified Vibrio]MDW1632779.1 phage minor tail protein G [Vibrio sp. Vb2907]MDW1703553.1 phage minor tail protein G [Vibrio sp. Vb2917]MDW1718101.1 phage minor tail protein G [Vibrio sp. Vb2979]